MCTDEASHGNTVWLQVLALFTKLAPCLHNSLLKLSGKTNASTTPKKDPTSWPFWPWALTCLQLRLCVWGMTSSVPQGLKLRWSDPPPICRIPHHQPALQYD